MDTWRRHVSRMDHDPIHLQRVVLKIEEPRRQDALTAIEILDQPMDVVRPANHAFDLVGYDTEGTGSVVLRSPDLSKEGTGFVTILDKDNKVVSNIGGTEPVYNEGVLQQMAQAEKIFVHPHDVCVDDEENLYVAQWASGKVYPYKFTRA